MSASSASGVVAGLLLFGALGGCRVAPDVGSDQPTPSSRSEIRFEDVTAQSGLASFQHRSGAFGKKWFPETMGSGLAVIDFDLDGWPDLMFASGGVFEETGSEPPPAARLFRNVQGSFEDVTDRVLPDVEAYSFGLTVADYDNDGDPDVYVTALHQNLLLRNDGEKFAEVAAELGVAGGRSWSTAAVFFDADRDGWLDLFVGHYVDWSPENDLFCSTTGVGKIYCTPEVYEGVTGRYYRNLGGRFEDLSETSRLTLSAKTLGAIENDFNRDGWPDLFVANDTDPDQLFQNMGDGTFRDVGPESGVAFDERGRARAGMGVAAGVTDDSGSLSFFVGNFSDEMVGVYRYLGNGVFLDRAAASQIGRPSIPTLAFGMELADFDLDGFPDLFVANGHVQVDVERIRDNTTFRQTPHLFQSLGDGTFADVAVAAGLGEPLVARGAVSFDFDLDGDLDLAVSQNEGGARLWRNDSPNSPRSVRLRLVGTVSNRDAVGSEVALFAAGASQTTRIVAGSSYLSTSERIATFSAGSDGSEIDSVVVRWPSGSSTRHHGIAGGRLYTLFEDGRTENGGGSW